MAEANLVKKMDGQVKLPDWLRLQPRTTETVKYPYTITAKFRRFPWEMLYKGRQARFIQCLFVSTGAFLYLSLSTSIKSARFPSAGHATRFEPVGASHH